jgi:hypothetical protein
MRTSLLMRAASASAAVALFLSLGLEAALARGQASFGSPAMRPGFAQGHGQGLGWRDGGRQSWTWRSRNSWSRNGRFWNQGGFYGSGFWYSPYGFADMSSGVSGGVPVIIVVGAPSFNDLPAAPNEGADPGSQGGCVIHKLTYDSAGKYVGERQTPGC